MNGNYQAMKLPHLEKCGGFNLPAPEKKSAQVRFEPGALAQLLRGSGYSVGTEQIDAL